MRLAILQGFEDHSKEFGFESVNKGKPQKGFSWKVVDPMTIWQGSLWGRIGWKGTVQRLVGRRRILYSPGLDQSVAEKMERNKLTQDRTDGTWR